MRKLPTILLCLVWWGAAAQGTLPEGFVYVADRIEDAVLEIRYYSAYNFMGARADGYEKPVAILTTEAAKALAAAAADLRSQGYIIKIFDAYRPQRAVDHFIRWAGDPRDQRTKEAFFPDVEKRDIFRLGYLARRSGHSRGSTVDLTLVDFTTGREADMGSAFDLLGEMSHHAAAGITPLQRRHREILRRAMIRAGFIPHPKEWWHYRLIGEPYPDTYFDFPVR